MGSTATVSDAIQRLYDGDSFKADNPDHNRLVIKHGRHFLVLNESGLMPPGAEQSPFGLYRDDTRYLNTWSMFVNGSQLRLLSSHLTHGFEADFVYGNQAVSGLQEQSLMVRRQLIISDRVHERITIRNYNPKHVDAELAIVFDADFADIFEVRGAKRVKRGEIHSAVSNRLSRPSGLRVKLTYSGLDGMDMQTTVDIRSKAKVTLSADGMLRIPVSLNNNQEVEVDITFTTSLGSESNKRIRRRTFQEAQTQAHEDLSKWNRTATTVLTENGAFNRLLKQAYQDLLMLRQPTPGGVGLAAGLPWFACAFGRDQAIAGMQILPFFPELAKSVVLNLASYQGTKTDSWREEKPGKIMHELRLGEMARNLETPFSPYYGTVDATPLWLMLLSRYVLWSADLNLAKQLWERILAAVDYLEAEIKPTGYLRYGQEENKTALTNQGWKDSFDSVSYSNGELTTGSIALVEPQGYLYAALTGLKEVSHLLNESDFAERLDQLASGLKKRFSKDFWMEDKDFPAIALDSDNNHCDVVSSNPGHLLGTGILTQTQEARVVEKLSEPDMMCLWGIRTLSSEEVAYNPMSYHNGSIWPHDNAMIVDGMGKGGYTEEAHRILFALLNLSRYRDDGRLPELVCGFGSNLEEGPISYPISCSPQAWSAGAPLQILASLLGISYDTDKKQVTISNPALPQWLGKVTVSNLLFGSLFLNLEFNTQDGKTNCTVVSKSKTLSVILD